MTDHDGSPPETAAGPGPQPASGTAPSPGPDSTPERFPGEGIVTTVWTALAVFTVTAVADRLGLDALELPATITALGLFAAGFVVWIVAFFRAVGRSRYDEITVPGLFFLSGSAPKAVQRHLLGAFLLSVGVAGATASKAPFGVMVPVFPLAMAGLWGARHGQFPPRRHKERGPRRGQAQ